MKITKKRLLKLGFREENKNCLKFNDQSNSLLVYFGINEKFEFVHLFTHSKNQTGATYEMFPDYKTLKTWCEVERGLILPEAPKQRSLKKAVKGLKKMIDVNSGDVQELIDSDSDQCKTIYHLDERLQALEQQFGMQKAINRTSAENAQVEKPIEFGCWVEVVNHLEEEGVYRTKGESGVVTHEYNKSSFDVAFLDCTETIEAKHLKRIKSPIE